MVPLASGASRVRVGGSGRPLLWTHGFLNSIELEEEIGLAAFLHALPGVSLVRYDARGHGRSTVGRDDGATRWSALGRDLLELADVLGLARPVAGGVSMGAAATLHAAVLAPDRFGGLLLLLPPTAWATRQAQADVYRGGAVLVEASGVEAYVEAAEATFRERPLPGFSEAMQKALLNGMRAMPAPALARVLRGAAASDLPEPSHLRALALPALLIATRDDPSHPLSTAERLAELLQGSELLVLDGPIGLAAARNRVTRFLERAA
jgi:pimeloyl-ACP methyl ester carboxylesterase